MTAPEIVDAVRAACEAAVQASDIERYDLRVRVDDMPVARLVLAGNYVDIWVGWPMARDAIDRVLKRTVSAAVKRLRDAAGGAFVSDVWPLESVRADDDTQAELQQRLPLERGALVKFKPRTTWPPEILASHGDAASQFEELLRNEEADLVLREECVDERFCLFARRRADGAEVSKWWIFPNAVLELADNDPRVRLQKLSTEVVHPEDVRAMLRRMEHLERLVAKLGAIATVTDPLEWEPADRSLILKEAREAYVALRARGHRPMLRSWTRSIGGDGGWCRLSCYDGTALRVVIPVHLNAQGWSVTSPDGQVTRSGLDVGVDAVVLAEDAAFALGWWT